MRRALKPRAGPLALRLRRQKSQLERRVEPLHGCLIEGIAAFRHGISGFTSGNSRPGVTNPKVGASSWRVITHPGRAGLRSDCATGDTAAPQTTAAMVASDALKRFLPLNVGGDPKQNFGIDIAARLQQGPRL